MRSRFQYIGRISWARKGKKGDTIYFGLTTWRHRKKGKTIIDYNNNFTIPKKKGQFAMHKFRMGNTVMVEGYIICTVNNRVQESRFIVTNYVVLHDFKDVELNHVEKYYDLPPEEFYDIFDDGAGFMPEDQSKSTTKDNILND